MRRIGLYSDVHANLPALEAVLAHMHAEGVTERYCLGDLVGYGPHPAEVIARIRALGDQVVQGNFDRAIGARLRDAGRSFSTPQETLDAAESYAHTIAAIDIEHERYLSGLPRHVTLEVDGARILLCHGSPRRVNELVPPDAVGALLASLARDAGADVVCSGHVHVPFHRSVPTERGVTHWVNAGSVGRPRDGDPRAAWVELVIGTHEEALSRASEDIACRRVGELGVWLSAHVHRVIYDVESVVEDIAAQGLPATLASALTTGSEEHHILAPTSVTYRMDRGHPRDPEVPDEARGVGHGPVHGHPADESRSDRPLCTCAISDRIVSYESFETIFRGDARQVADAVTRLEVSMRTCRKNPHVDDQAIHAAYLEAVEALATTDGSAAFLAERERLYGDCRRFDPFNHVLSATEITYLAGEEDVNRAELEVDYEAADFVPAEFEGGCVGHISVEMAFMAHCLLCGAGGERLALAREFFVEHLADWAVLFAVVTAQQAREPVMRYAGLALDKYLICEAATFRTAVPEYCEARHEPRP